MSARPRAARSLALLGTALLGGCAGLHSSARPDQTYYLQPQPAAAASATPALAASLRIGRPAAAPGLDSAHIMLVEADHRMDFYAGSRWPGPAPEVIESLAVATLRSSGAWSAVEDSSSPFPADYLLGLVVRRFEADYGAAGAAPVVQVALDCTLGRHAGREVIATFTASASAPAAANRLGDVVVAFEQATDAALASLAQQAAAAARADPQRAPHPAGTP
jgi:cholesterol transport system auxiliary component